MNRIGIVFKREFASYFNTPIAYVFIIVFLLASGYFTFVSGRLFESGQADLAPFFYFHPRLYLLLIPAIAMRLWAEERKSGSVELLMTLPVSVTDLVVAKFLAAWAFTGIALALTFPVWMTVNYLGSPDNGAIFTGYIGSFLMAGCFVSIGSCMSAATKNQVIAFILTVTACFMFLVPDFLAELLGNAFSSGVIDAIRSAGFGYHFEPMSKGVLDFRNLLYFLLLMAFWLYATKVVLNETKAS